MTQGPSTAFELYDPRIQKWIWGAGWKELRDIQERAARPLLETKSDVLLSSATASGKTEAVFLPLATLLATKGASTGIDILYVSPLKALINDQQGRLESLMKTLGVNVHRWHGDVSHSKKRKVVEDPRGVLLITPESLEAHFVRRGSQVGRLLSGLTAIVVDELHAYIGTERGRQLQSLLHRIDLVLGRSVRRIAMSATLGDMETAAEFLRPMRGRDVILIVSDAGGAEVRLQIRGYVHRSPEGDPRALQGETSDSMDEDVVEISDHIFRHLRGGRHLVFANRRGEVELYSDLLARMCQRGGLPNEFMPHHGNLDRSIREEAERRLRESTAPATVIATTTLELGIDIGSVESIAQIGPPPSVMSMRQRLGRSGRRGTSAILRIYVQEPEIDARTPPHDQLRAHLVQSVAMVRLLAQRWFEPPVDGAFHMSTLVQQVLSAIAQKGSVTAKTVWVDLCQQGPFHGIDARMFAEFLQALAAHDLITQTGDGEIVLGLTGERLVNHYEFYAAFATPDEYRVVTGGKSLGSLPILSPLVTGHTLIFAGRRWRIESVDEVRRVVQVVGATGGRPPLFGGGGPLIHDGVRSEMRHVFEGSEKPPYLDSRAGLLLTEGRETFRRFGLHTKGLLPWGQNVLLFPWVGDRALHTLAIWLRHVGLDASPEREAILVENGNEDQVVSALRSLREMGAPDAMGLASSVMNKQSEKHHQFLNESLLKTDYASSSLDAAGAVRALENLLSRGRD